MRDRRYWLQLALLAFDQAAYLLKKHLKEKTSATKLRFIYIACVGLCFYYGTVHFPLCEYMYQQ